MQGWLARLTILYPVYTYTMSYIDWSVHSITTEVH